MRKIVFYANAVDEEILEYPDDTPEDEIIFDFKEWAAGLDMGWYESDEPFDNDEEDEVQL